jgi:hypothetical protein
MERRTSMTKYIYFITILFLVVTGFSQMPISKRYYIADVPGLAWTAEFFVTHYMHYLFSIVLIALAAYVLAYYLLALRKKTRPTVSGYIRSGLIGGLIATGALMVIVNLPGTPFSTTAIIILDLAHLSLCMAFLGVSLYALLAKKRWLE